MPKNLNESLEFLECNIPDEDKEIFAETLDSDLIQYHLSLGKFIRNKFGLWNMDTELYNYFKSNNISDPESISSIIITSFHRKLNNKDIRIQEQFEEYHNYVQKAILEQKERDLKSKEFFNSFTLNDTVEFYFDISFNNGKKMVFLGPNIDIDQHHSNLCKGKGVVAKKIGRDKHYGYEIKIKLIHYCDLANLMKDEKKLKKGDTINYYIERYNIKNTSTN